MRRMLVVAAQALLAGSALCATFDIDADLMRGIDDTAKSLDSNVAQRDAKAAGADARSLVETWYGGPLPGSW